MEIRYINKMNKRGQNSLEYVVLITLVAAVLLSTIWLMHGASPFQEKLIDAFNTVGDKIVYEIEQVK